MTETYDVRGTKKIRYGNRSTRPNRIGSTSIGNDSGLSERLDSRSFTLSRNQFPSVLEISS